MEHEFWKAKPVLTHLSEEEIMHTVLEYVATRLPPDNLMHEIDPAWVLGGDNINKFLNLTMPRMASEGLITTERSRQGRVGYTIRATPYGIRVALHPGGYHAHYAAQRNAVQQESQAKFETERLNREAAKATVDAASSARVSAKASERAVRVSVIGTVVASLIALTSIVVQVVLNNNAAADLALAQSQIKELHKQVKALSARR